MQVTSTVEEVIAEADRVLGRGIWHREPGQSQSFGELAEVAESVVEDYAFPLWLVTSVWLVAIGWCGGVGYWVLTTASGAWGLAAGAVGIALAVMFAGCLAGVWHEQHELR